MRKSTYACLIPLLFVTPVAVAQLYDLDLDNGTIHVGVETTEYGGAITYLSLSGTTDNLVNGYDRGREIQQSYYAGQRLDRTSEGQSPYWSPFPWNPIQVGDYCMNSSAVLESSKTGGVIYTKTLPLLWDMENEAAQCHMEQWTSLEGNVVHVRCKLTCFRDPGDLWDQEVLQAQELPAVYTIADLPYWYTYLGTEPWTSGPLTRLDRELFNDEPPEDGIYHVQATEYWSANVDDTSGNGWGLGVFNKNTIRHIGGLHGTPGGGATDDSTSYLSPFDLVSLGRDSVYEYEYDLIVGTLAEIRQYAYDHRPSDAMGPKIWDFDGDNDDWFAINHIDNFSVTGGTLQLDVTGNDPYMQTCSIVVPASENHYLHIRLKNGTDSDWIQVFWQNAYGSPGMQGYDLFFPISSNDTDFKDYVFDLSAASGWTGLIESLRIDPGWRTGHFEIDRIAVWDSPILDRDRDGISDDDETADLDPDTPGVQNPFDPEVADATGDNGSVGADGIPDGQNDWDGDGMSNADEFTWGYDPLDPESFTEVPVAWWPVVASLVLVAGLMLAVRRRKRAQSA